MWPPTAHTLKQTGLVALAVALLLLLIPGIWKIYTLLAPTHSTPTPLITSPGSTDDERRQALMRVAAESTTTPDQRDPQRFRALGKVQAAPAQAANQDAQDRRNALLSLRPQ